MVSPQQTLEAFDIAKRGYAINRKFFHHILKTIYCKRKEQFDRFDEMFDRFWSRHYEEKLEQRKIKVKPKKENSKTDTIVFMGATFKKPAPKKESEDAKKSTGANKTVRLSQIDFTKLDVTDQEKLDELAENLFYQMSLKMKRRLQNAKNGKIDIQRTIRSNINKGGMLLNLKYKKNKKEKRNIVFLLDISGSMDTYSFYLLKFVLTLKKYFKSLEFFTFSTSLTHITPMLKANNEQEIFEKISQNVNAWSSGTKIGKCLQEFLSSFGNRHLSQKHVVVILSDGLETENVSLLKSAVQTIKRKCKSLIWLNPLKGMKNYQPIQKGIVNVMPHLDAFESVHNLESLLKLEKLLMDV